MSSSSGSSDTTTDVPDVQSSPSPPPDPDFIIPGNRTLREVHTYLSQRRNIQVVTFVIANIPIAYDPLPDADKDLNFVRFINLRILQPMRGSLLNFGLYTLLKGRSPNAFVNVGRGTRIQRLYFTVMDNAGIPHYVAYNTDASDPNFYVQFDHKRKKKKRGDILKQIDLVPIPENDSL